MDTLELLKWIGIGGCFGLSATGASWGMAYNGPAVIGAWKKCYLQNKPAPFLIIVFAGTPLSNIIYGFILMIVLAGPTSLNAYAILTLGLGSGACIMVIAATQAMCAAAAADAYVETGKGYGLYLMVVGIAETISIFAVAFTIMMAYR